MEYYVWTATFEYMGERPDITIYTRPTQPAEFEFVRLMNERMRNRKDYDPSKLRLLNITKRK